MKKNQKKFTNSVVRVNKLYIFARFFISNF